MKDMFAESCLSVRCHSQGESPYQCWAFSCTTMLRHSWMCFLDQLEQTGNFPKSEILAERAYIQTSEVFKEIKNLLMLIGEVRRSFESAGLLEFSVNC